MNVQFQQFKTHFILPPAILIADKTIHAQPSRDLGLISNILVLLRICNNSVMSSYYFSEILYFGVQAE